MDCHKNAIDEGNSTSFLNALILLEQSRLSTLETIELKNGKVELPRRNWDTKISERKITNLEVQNGTNIPRKPPIKAIRKVNNGFRVVRFLPYQIKVNWEAGIDVMSHRSGCFSYKNEIIYIHDMIKIMG